MRLTKEIFAVVYTRFIYIFIIIIIILTKAWHKEGVGIALHQFSKKVNLNISHKMHKVGDPQCFTDATAGTIHGSRQPG